MINQLRKIFKSLLIYNKGINNLDPEYKWFLADNHEIIGVHNEELTTKDASLLAAFLSPYNIKYPVLTDTEQKWSKLIHSTTVTSEADFILDAPYRFVYFSIKKMKRIRLC